MLSYSPLPNKPSCFDQTIFNFKILSLVKEKINDQENVVTEVSWAILGNYNDITTTHEVTTKFSKILLINQTLFQDYSSLTEDIVKSWIATEESLYHLKCSICNQIESDLNSSAVTTKLPWETLLDPSNAS